MEVLCIFLLMSFYWHKSIFPSAEPEIRLHIYGNLHYGYSSALTTRKYRERNC